MFFLVLVKVLSMRAKGSSDNLMIGLEFANAITIYQDYEKASCNGVAVNCKGKNSVFAALSVCLPDLVRIEDTRKALRGAISETELCKFLIRSGYVPYRQRSRVKGTKDKWNKTVLQWKHRRWINPLNPEECMTLKAKLAALQDRLCHSGSISEKSLLSFLCTIACDFKLNAKARRGPMQAPENEPASQAEALEKLEMRWQQMEHVVPNPYIVTHRRFVPLQTHSDVQL